MDDQSVVSQLSVWISCPDWRLFPTAGPHWDWTALSFAVPQTDSLSSPGAQTLPSHLKTTLSGCSQTPPQPHCRSRGEGKGGWYTRKIYLSLFLFMLQAFGMLAPHLEWTAATSWQRVDVTLESTSVPSRGWPSRCRFLSNKTHGWWSSALSKTDFILASQAAAVSAQRVTQSTCTHEQEYTASFTNLLIS